MNRIQIKNCVVLYLFPPLVTKLERYQKFSDDVHIHFPPCQLNPLQLYRDKTSEVITLNCQHLWLT